MINIEIVPTLCLIVMTRDLGDGETDETTVILARSQMNDISKIVSRLESASEMDLGGYFIWPDDLACQELIQIESHLAEMLIEKTKEKEK